nr:unnamed protein product [Digitaria exilis]
MDELVGQRARRNVGAPPRGRTEEWRKQQVAESERMSKEENQRYMAEFEVKYPHEDWSDLLAVGARNYREHWESIWSSVFGSFEATSPTRAVVVCDPVYFEVVLKVKGNVESEDKDLSLLTEPLTNHSSILYTCLMSKDYTSKLSTLELTFGYVVDSVEATISVCITEGSWPDGYIGQVTAHTSSLKNRVLLLRSEFEKMPVSDDGMIKLSRCVASVELEGKLTVSVVAFQHDHDDYDRINVVGKDEEDFSPRKSGKSYGRLDVGFCKMDVTVA